MKYKWKRPLAWMMSAALVFSIPGISVYADDMDTGIISPFSTIWDGTTSLSGGSYEVASDITITGEITISNNTTVTVVDGAKISVADGAVLNVISSQIQGSVSVSGTLNVDQSFVGTVVTADPTSIDITNYSIVNKVDVTTFMSNLYVTGGAKVGEISANVRFGNIYIQNADTVVSKLSMKAGTVSVSQGATLTEAILAPTGTTPTTKGKITNQGNIGSVTVNGYGVVNNYDNGIIDTVTIAALGPGERGYDNLSNYSNGQINTVLVKSGSLSNGTVAAGTGTIENLTVEGGTAKNTNGTIEAIDHILAEREEDKKKIEELEKEIKKNKMYLIMASEVIDNSVLKPKVKDELEKAKSENEPYELHNKESRMYWLNQGKISLAKKILEDK